MINLDGYRICRCKNCGKEFVEYTTNWSNHSTSCAECSGTIRLVQFEEAMCETLCEVIGAYLEKNPECEVEFNFEEYVNKFMEDDGERKLQLLQYIEDIINS